MPLIPHISFELANKFYTWGWRASVAGAVITAIALVFLFLGTRVRDRAFEAQVADTLERAGKLEIAAEELRQTNLKLQSDVERERIARLELQRKYGPRILTGQENLALITALHEGGVKELIIMRVEEMEAAIAADKLRETLTGAGINVEILGLGTLIPPRYGVSVYDPAGPDGPAMKAFGRIVPNLPYDATPPAENVQKPTLRVYLKPFPT